MFEIALVVLIVTCTTVWQTYKRETARKDMEHLRAGRHRASDRPTMTWRG